MKSWCGGSGPLGSIINCVEWQIKPNVRVCARSHPPPHQTRLAYLSDLGGGRVILARVERKRFHVMTDHHVKVTYNGPALFLASGQWTHVLDSLKKRLPLRSLHWKSASRPSIRSVQELDVEVVSLDNVRDEPSSQIPATLLERPLLNIYFVACEVSSKFTLKYYDPW